MYLITFLEIIFFCSLLHFHLFHKRLLSFKRDSLQEFFIFMISFISSFEIVNVSRFDKSEGRATDPRTFLRIAESVAAAVAVNLNDIKTLLANCLSTFSIKDNPVFSNDPKSIPTNTPGCTILYN